MSFFLLDLGDQSLLREAGSLWVGIYRDTVTWGMPVHRGEPSGKIGEALFYLLSGTFMYALSLSTVTPHGIT